MYAVPSLHHPLPLPHTNPAPQCLFLHVLLVIQPPSHPKFKTGLHNLFSQKSFPYLSDVFDIIEAEVNDPVGASLHGNGWRWLHPTGSPRRKVTRVGKRIHSGRHQNHLYRG